MHGYELRKRLNAVLGAFRPLSYGTALPVPARPARPRLDHRGTGTTGSTAPPAPSSRRARIVYELTADGKDHFQSLIAQSGPAAWEDDTFDVHFAFFSRTEAAVRLRILEGRRSRLEERLDAIRTAAARSRERLDLYTAELQRHGLDSAEREVRWLSELIETERSATPPAPALTLPQPPPPGRPSLRHETATHRLTHRHTPSEGEPHGIRSRRHRRRRQLRQLAGAGRRVLQGRRPERQGPRTDARQVR